MHPEKATANETEPQKQTLIHSFSEGRGSPFRLFLHSILTQKETLDQTLQSLKPLQKESQPNNF